MIVFRTNKDNSDYLDINRVNLGILAIDTDIPHDVFQAIEDIYSCFFDYEKKFGYIAEITILKESTIGKYLLDAHEDILNDDFLITYEKVVNAFNTAIYTGEALRNKELGFNLHQMFLNKTNEYYDKLSINYSLEVLDYIVDNCHFEDLIKKEKEDYEPEEYNVYENGYFMKKPLYEKEKVKVKEK